jgi:rubredoxin
MKLSRWKCSTCGFEWFEQLQTPETVSSIDHGCPQGCDDAGRIIGKIEATDNDDE